MNIRLLCVFLLAAAALGPAGAQTQSKESVIRLDPAFDAIVAPGTMVETLKEGFGFMGISIGQTASCCRRTRNLSTSMIRPRG